MAQLRRVVRDNPVSNFTQAAPQGGLGFSLLAQAAEAIYDRVAPVAEQRMAERGAEAGREWARQQVGGMPSMGGPSGPASSYREAIAQIESSGRYDAIGPLTEDGQRAYGRYQVMDFNVGPWTEKYVGRRMTPQEFLADPAAQDAVFEGEFGSYVQRFGNPQDAASMWFTGRPQAQGANARDVTGTSGSEYVRAFNRALGQQPEVARQEPEVVVRTSEGRLEPRMFSPFSGPILQAHNIAAGIAYNAEMLEKGAVDLFDLSTRFPLNPDGFSSAAQGYIDQVVEAAPDAFKATLRGALEDQVGKRVLGMVEERHRDIRQRADNSSKALAERYSNEYADALAAGNTTEIEAARARLQDVLRGREALPGVAWTPEQSANVFLEAERRSQSIVREQVTAQRNEIKDQLQTVVTAAKEGLTSAYDMLLVGPYTAEMEQILATMPEQVNEARGWRAFADAMPGFAAGTQADRDAQIAALREAPIAEPWQAQMQTAAESQNKAVTQAWRDSPIDAAQSYLPEKPPALPQPDDPSFGDALAARAAYAEGLVEAGYTDRAAYWSDAERQSLSAALSKTSPVEIRATLAAGIVSAMGPAAVGALGQLDAADPVTVFGAMLTARGGSQATFIEAMRGQAALDEGLVQRPTPTERQEALPPDVRATLEEAMLMAGKNPEREVGALMDFATALYGANPTAGLDGALQKALGQQTNARGDLTGGVQEIMGHQTLLPVGVSGADVARALGAATTGYTPRTGFWGGMATIGAGLSAARTGEPLTPRPEAWIEAAGSPPYAAGEPLPASYFASNAVRLIPAGGSRYRMMVEMSGGMVPVEGADGLSLIVDINRLIEATR